MFVWLEDWQDVAIGLTVHTEPPGMEARQFFNGEREMLDR